MVEHTCPIIRQFYLFFFRLSNKLVMIKVDRNVKRERKPIINHVSK